MQRFFEFNFVLDDFQQESIDALENGNSVVVCAPTGAGKTVIAEYAINMAIKQNKRVFYTTPLKALSNQKFRDFQNVLGEENVGLLTGDISINRDASVVVMTTEVFRNMLYGTHFGSIDEAMKTLFCVVLDECHYMNDSDRGTVWEESIIYCPNNIKILALSATIANADELTDWINTVHSKTVLVHTDFRPVPLRHFYYDNNQVMPLVAPGGKLNRKIQRIKLNKGTIAKMRGRSPATLLKILDAKEMLPAIYFCFSRKRCNEYLMKCSQIDLLTGFERKRLEKIIDDYIKETPILLKNRHLHYIYSGVAAHHAGLLPAWKVLIEKLFQQGLIKVVFATETLAAGINMPARTTIISEISKRSDEGHRNLTASEFLQMSGRAGRRGMDKIGYVVTMASPFHSPKEILGLALSPSDPLNSQFMPTYSMVLNLLQRFKLEEARQLILSSFGYFNSSKRLSPLNSDRDRLKSQINSLINFHCPYNLSNDNLARYYKTKDIYIETKRIFGYLKKHNKRTDPELIEYRNKTESLHSELKRVQCYKCDLYKKHIKSQDMLQRLNKRLLQLEKTIETEQDLYWNQFLNLVKVLEKHGYIKNNTPQEAGICASMLKCENELYMVEILNSGVLDTLNAPELAAVFCALISEEPRGNNSIRNYPGKNARRALEDIYYIARSVKRNQKAFNVEVPTLLNMHYSWIAQMWTEGCQWDDIVSKAGMDEGDIVRTLKRTVDILRQVSKAPYLNPELVTQCHQAYEIINREPITEIF